MKTLIVTKNHLLILLAVIIVLFGSISYLGIGKVVSTSAQMKKKLPIYAVNTQEKKIALTFDCAWENSDTKILMDLLDENKIKATFFTTGDWCKRFPDDVKLFASRGHAVENHSYNHPHVANMETQKLIDDTQKCNEIIEELTGKRPTLYRAPYGEYSNNMLDCIENEFNQKVIQWDVDSRDWQGREVCDMVDSVVSKVKNGSIVLFHNDTKNTPQALAQIIPKLKGDGYEFVLVSELIYFDGYTLDHEGRQVKK